MASNSGTAKGLSAELDANRKSAEFFAENLQRGFAYCKIITDKNGKPVDYIYLYVNDVYVEITGSKQETVLDKKATELFPTLAKDPADWINKYGKVAKTGKSERFEAHLQFRNAWYSLFVYSPKKGYFAVIFDDITERKKSELALKEREEEYGSLFANMLNGFAYCKMIFDDAGEPVDFVYLQVNEAFEKITGIKKERVIGKKVTEAIPGIREENPELFGIYGRVAQTCQKEKFDIFFKPLNMWLHLSVYCPKKGYFAAVFENITQSKKAEEKLLESEEKFRNLAEESPNMIFINQGGRVVYANKKGEEIVGYSKEEFYSPTFNFLNLTPPEYAEAVKLSFAKHLRGEEVAPYEYVLITKEGKRIDAIIATKLIDFEGEKAILGIVTDITEQKKTEAKLEEYKDNLEKLVEERTKQLKDAERLAAIGATAGMVGHDIRNPLQAILSDTYLLKEELTPMPQGKTKEAVAESLESIEKNIDYINKIVQDLQDYARPLNPQKEKTDFDLIVRKLLKKNGIPNNIKVSIVVEDDAKTIDSDSYYINRILYNLVTNAIQAMQKGGKLTIRTHKQANDIVISVKDTGVGIPKDIQDKLFTPMFTTKAKGQGFGLPVVKRMTEGLGGTVTFESEEGKGTTFTVRLPKPQKN